MCDLESPNSHGGSDYYLKSVYKVKQINNTQSKEEFYFKHLGCYRLNNSSLSTFIQFSQSSIKNCSIHCEYLNFSILASMGDRCFCLNSTFNNNVKVNNLTNCGEENTNLDYHFNGDQAKNYSDVYRIFGNIFYFYVF